MTKQTLSIFIFFILFMLSAFGCKVYQIMYGGVPKVMNFMTIIFFFALLISFFYSVYTLYTKGIPKDLWKVAFLAVFGILGVLGFFGVSEHLHTGFIGFSGFYRVYVVRKEYPKILMKIQRRKVKSI